MDQHIERIVNQIPGWSTGNAVVTPLLGGITNQNYRVDISGETFVLRIGGKRTHLLGIDRLLESMCTAIAAQVGVGAEVMHFLASEEALVTRFIVGSPISPEIAAQPGTLRRIVASMQRYHRGPAFPGEFSPFTTVRNYHHLALEYGVTFPLAEKAVVRGGSPHPFYKWAAAERPLETPRWNFHKYLVGRDGRIAAVFPTDVEPMDARVINAIVKELGAR